MENADHAVVSTLASSQKLEPKNSPKVEPEKAESCGFNKKALLKWPDECIGTGTGQKIKTAKKAINDVNDECGETVLCPTCHSLVEDFEKHLKLSNTCRVVQDAGPHMFRQKASKGVKRRFRILKKRIEG